MQTSLKPDGQNSVISFVISEWLLPELSIPAAGQKDRGLWGRESISSDFVFFVLSASGAILFLVEASISSAKSSGVSQSTIVGSADRKAVPQTHYSQAKNCFAMLSSLHPLWPWLRLLNSTCACSTMLKERGKRLQLRFNILNISENKKCWSKV